MAKVIAFKEARNFFKRDEGFSGAPTVYSVDGAGPGGVIIFIGNDRFESENFQAVVLGEDDPTATAPPPNDEFENFNSFDDALRWLKRKVPKIRWDLGSLTAFKKFSGTLL